MLVRIVRMSFEPDAVDTFLEYFDSAAPRIRAFPGCEHLELWQDADAPTVFATCSHWTTEEALEAYRTSDLFRSTWTRVKSLFADDPEARSYRINRTIDDSEEPIGGPSLRA